MSSDNIRKRRPSEILKRGYSDQEIDSIYALAKLSLENGNVRRAEALFKGISEVAPEYFPAWLGLAYVHLESEDYDPAVYCIRQALRVNPNSVEAMLYLVAVLLSTGDFGTAGSYLGEIGDFLAANPVESSIEKFYQVQLARYQNR